MFEPLFFAIFFCSTAMFYLDDQLCFFLSFFVITALPFTSLFPSFMHMPHSHSYPSEVGCIVSGQFFFRTHQMSYQCHTELVDVIEPVMS